MPLIVSFCGNISQSEILLTCTASVSVSFYPNLSSAATKIAFSFALFFFAFFVSSKYFPVEYASRVYEKLVLVFLHF